jgi:hypothetical protein
VLARRHLWNHPTPPCMEVRLARDDVGEDLPAVGYDGRGRFIAARRES